MVVEVDAGRSNQFPTVIWVDADKRGDAITGCDDCNTKPVEFDRLLGNGCAPRRLQTKYPDALPGAVGACWEQAVAVAVPLMPAG
jgi:hypothetical protein